MKAFVWHRVENATSNFHNEAALLVIAADLDAARALIAAREVTDDWGEPGACEALTKEPSAVYDLADEPEPRVWVFPDAGCC